MNHSPVTLWNKIMHSPNVQDNECEDILWLRERQRLVECPDGIQDKSVQRRGINSDQNPNEARKLSAACDKRGAEQVG